MRQALLRMLVLVFMLPGALGVLALAILPAGGEQAAAQTVAELAQRPLTQQSLAGEGHAPAAAARQAPDDARPRIPVAATTIYPGEVITAAMLRLRPVSRRFARRGGFVADPAAIIGKMARRTLPRGRPVPPNALREPYVVRSGKAVRIIFRSGALRISALGVALASASAGEPVAVRNVDSGRIVHGVAQPDGTVRVGAQGMR